MVFDIIEQVSGQSMSPQGIQSHMVLVPFEDVVRPTVTLLRPHLVMRLESLSGRDKEIWGRRLQDVLKAREDARVRRDVQLVRP